MIVLFVGHAGSFRSTPEVYNAASCASYQHDALMATTIANGCRSAIKSKKDPNASDGLSGRGKAWVRANLGVRWYLNDLTA